MKKFAWIAVPLAVAACILLMYVPEAEKAPARPSPQQAAPGGLPSAQALHTADKGRGASLAEDASAPDERAPERKSKKKGDLTTFSLTWGELGYVDVNSILQHRNPYSVVALLQKHRGLTGADDSLEITIDRIEETEIWGHEALFTQVIEGRPTKEGGAIFFSPTSGTVTWVYGDIIDARSLNPGGILILAPEAEAIARRAAERYAETLEPANPEWSALPVSIASHAAEMRYELDSNDELMRLWRVYVSIGGSLDAGIRVSISPETGEVIGVKNAVVQSGTGTRFILCDATGIPRMAKRCDLYSRTGSPRNVLVGGECKLTPPALCQQPKYAIPLETVKGVIRDVRATSDRLIKSPIHIVVNYPFGGTTHGDWDEAENAIRLDDDLQGEELVCAAAHEAFHAASKTPEGGIEHGLVYAMTAIWTGNAGDWHYAGNPVTNNDFAYSLVGEVAANAIYRVFQKVGAKKAFKFVLDVDLQQPTDLQTLATAMEIIGRRSKIEAEVAEALAAQAAGSEEEPPVIFAAASTTAALGELAARHERRGRRTPRLSFASSATLARQILNGAQPALFLSANRRWMDALDEAGLLASGTRQALLGNRLAIIRLGGPEQGVSLENPDTLLAALGDAPLVLGDPAHVPAGLYAREALQRLGIWARLKGRLAFAPNARAVTVRVSRGEAPLGITYASELNSEASLVAAAWFPEDSHSPIRYELALVESARNPSALAFYEYLFSGEAQQVFVHHGFSPGREGILPSRGEKAFPLSLRARPPSSRR